MVYPIFPWPIESTRISYDCPKINPSFCSLTHARSVDVDLLGSCGLVVKVKGTIVDVEGGILLLGASAAGLLSGQTSKDAALGGVERRVLDTRPGVDGNDTEGAGLSGGSGSGSGRETGGNEDALELHDEMLC